MSITTHVLDTARGEPASGIRVHLETRDGNGWRGLGSGETDGDGRARNLIADGRLEPGTYRLRFATDEYFDALGIESFHPEVAVVFRICDPDEHYHVPLLLSPFGYTTYRGS
ncbi:MAG: hydroxyisourate hydrolase [Gemmatimonadota bacterium]